MNKQNLLKRVLSGIVIFVIFLTAIFIFRPLFYLLFSIITILMLIEWHNMTKISKLHITLGYIVIPISIAALLLISYIDKTGWLLLTFFVIIWSVDVMAMFGGKLLQGAKLAPKLSPNKTISGLITGVVSALIAVHFLTMVDNYDVIKTFFVSQIMFNIFCLVIAIFAQISDLFISYFKRKFNIKDTGKIIPGHGGVLDRFDSIILTAPIVALYILNY